MKLFLIFLLTIPNLILAQKNYAPLGAEWNYEGYSAPNVENSLPCEGNHLQFKVELEKEIDGKNCSVIYGYKSTNINTDFEFSGDSLIVWEDNGKIFFYQNNEFYPMYDFTAEVGDTITHFDPNNNSMFSILHDPNNDAMPFEFQFVVYQVGEIEISEQTYKLQWTLPIWIDYCKAIGPMIENIGSTSHGLTGDFCSYPAAGCFGGLQCYTNNEIEYITDEEFHDNNPACGIINSSDDIFETHEILIYPNPTFDRIYLSNQYIGASFVLFSIKGQLIKKGKFTEFIDVSKLNSGMYFLKLDLTSLESKTIKLYVK